MRQQLITEDERLAEGKEKKYGVRTLELGKLFDCFPQLCLHD